MENGIGIFMIIVYLAIVVFIIASVWKVYEKAGKPGWAAIIPIYNVIVLLEIVKRPIWWLVLLLIPLVNLVILFVVHIELAKQFGKSAGFGVGLTLFGIVFYPILGFGDAEYLGNEPLLEDHLVA